MFIFALSEIEIEPEHLHDLEIEHLSGDRYGFLISFPYIINDRVFRQFVILVRCLTFADCRLVTNSADKQYLSLRTHFKTVSFQLLKANRFKMGS